MTDHAHKLVTSLEVSRKLADVLGYDMVTCFVWNCGGENAPGYAKNYAHLVRRSELTNNEPLPGMEHIPAYTVTELAALNPVSAHITDSPDDVAEQCLHYMGGTLGAKQARANYEEWRTM